MTRITSRVGQVAAVVALAVSGTVGASVSVTAAPPVHTKGKPPKPSPTPTTTTTPTPTPTATPTSTPADLTVNGPHAFSSVTVANAETPGFGAATIYYPTASGTYGGVAISPGFWSTQAQIRWYGPRLASHGFVVITIDTNSTSDSPDSRGTQLLAALDYLTGTSSVKDKVDAARLAVMGHSMGGGGSLAAAKARPSLRAAIPLTPYHTDKTWPEVTTPTFVIGAENDGIAPVGSHAEPLYEGLPADADRAYLELNAAGHSAPNSDDPTISTYSVAWLKRFVDGDTAYSSYLCPGPVPSSAVEEYRSTCPF